LGALIATEGPELDESENTSGGRPGDERVDQQRRSVRRRIDRQKRKRGRRAEEHPGTDTQVHLVSRLSETGALQVGCALDSVRQFDAAMQTQELGDNTSERAKTGGQPEGRP
jgi:hypothetical protein